MKKVPKKKTSSLGVVVLLVVAMAIIAIFYISPNTPEPAPGAGTPGGTNTSGEVLDCGDLQIDINSVKEATAYIRFGISRPAPEDSKFEILNLTLTNKGIETRDFSGYRLELLADSTSYISTSFSNIEKITLLDGPTADYPCRESKIASVSRLTLGPGESETGCKVFQILKSLEPASIKLSNLAGYKCSVKL